MINNRIISCLRSWSDSSIDRPLYVSERRGVPGSWITKGPRGSVQLGTQCSSLVYLKETHSLIASFIKTKGEPEGGEIWISNDDGVVWKKMPGFSMSLQEGEEEKGDDDNDKDRARVTTETGSSEESIETSEEGDDHKKSNVNDFNIVISATTGGATGGTAALYVFAGGVKSSPTRERLWTCYPVSVNCVFRVVTPIKSSVSDQYAYNLVLMADPNALDRVYIGGSYSSASQEHMLRCDGIKLESASSKRAKVAGGCFTLVRNGTSDNSEPHADSRVMVLDSNGDMLQGDDGGVWKRTSPSNGLGHWVSLNGNLRTAECHSGAVYHKSSPAPATSTFPMSSNWLAACGSQDNGVSIGAPGEPWLIMTEGDGGNVRLWSQSGSDDSRLYTSSQYLGYDPNYCYPLSNSFGYFPLSSFPYTSCQTPGSWGGVSLPVVGDICSQEMEAEEDEKERLPFYTEFEINPFSPPYDLRFVFLTQQRVYEVFEHQQNSPASAWPPMLIGEVGVECDGRGGSVVGSRDNPDLLWVALCDGVLYRDSFSKGLKHTRFNHKRFGLAFDIDADPEKPSTTAYVLTQTRIDSSTISRKKNRKSERSFGYSTAIVKTTDAGKTFKSITGDLEKAAPSNRVSRFESPEFVTLSVVRSSARNNTNLIFVGGKQGLFVAEDAFDSGSNHKNRNHNRHEQLRWSRVTSIPSVYVAETSVNHEEDTMVVSTVGRGVWLLRNISQLALLRVKT